MYAEFFNLREKPFNLTPSPRFLYLGESHREALALLTYGVVERKGFILLTGEVGTGKTTIVQALLKTLDKRVERVHLSNPLLSPREFIGYLAHSVLKSKPDLKSKADFLLAFEEYLRKCAQQQSNFVLIIDEAQKLSFELLEEIRLLSNMETADEKLINIFLVGQPELNDKLSEPRCRPLLQRISVRHHIAPLNLNETGEYIRTRLQVAGSSDPNKVFAGDAIKAVHRFSQGYPRMINILSDNALLLAYSRGTRKITDRVIEECYNDLQLEGSVLRSRPEVPPAVGEGDAKRQTKTHRVWKRVAGLFILVLVLLALGFTRQGKEVVAKFIGLSRVSDEKPRTSIAPKPLVVKPIFTPKEVEAPPPAEKPPEITPSEKPLEKTEEVAPSAVATDAVQPIIALRPVPGRDFPGQGRSVVVKAGDSLSKMALEVYGRADEKTLALLQKNNPGIADPDLISIGQEIFFPPLRKEDKR